MHIYRFHGGLFGFYFFNSHYDPMPTYCTNKWPYLVSWRLSRLPLEREKSTKYIETFYNNRPTTTTKLNTIGWMLMTPHQPCSREQVIFPIQCIRKEIFEVRTRFVLCVCTRQWPPKSYLFLADRFLFMYDLVADLIICRVQ